MDAGRIEAAVVAMYSAHPSPSAKDKLGFASERMRLRLACCGIEPPDYVGRSVLDAGCGTGEYAAWFASQGAKVTGVDLSDGSLAEARAYAAAHGLDIRFEKRSVLATGFDAGSFDLIYCTGVLHHTPDPAGGFGELCRLLRPNGKILVSLYNRLSFLPREMRRQVARLLGGSDPERRVTWGRRLFPRTSRRAQRLDRNDRDSGLYDYFGIPHETLHSVGEVLDWFDANGLVYAGCFPPPRLRDYPALVRSEEYERVDPQHRPRWSKWVGWLDDGDGIARTRPGPLSRAMAQTLWLSTGVQMMSMAAVRPDARPRDGSPG